MSTKKSKDLATVETEKIKQFEKVQLMQEQNRAQMNNHMSFIVGQKDEIVRVRDRLEAARVEGEEMKFMHKKLSKAEEERMKDVIKTTIKIT